MKKVNSLTNRRNLNGKIIVITGASSGVGRAAALAFARHSVKLVLAARREVALEELAAECREMGAMAIVVPTDVTNAAAVKRLAAAAVEHFGRIDIWVNNAGVLAAGGFTETPVEVHDQVIRTNLLGYLHGAHAVLPVFKKQRDGILINNISVGGWFPTPYAVGYSASKFGIRGFSAALRGEMSKWPDIHICDLFPAFLDTPGIQHAANYTGRVLKPAPPVYDPRRVAEAMISVARHPRSVTTIGIAENLLRLIHTMFPVLSLTMTAKFIEGYFKVADPIAETSGNLFEAPGFGTSIYGGWSKPVPPAKKKMAAVLLVSALAAGWLYARRSK